MVATKPTSGEMRSPSSSGGFDHPIIPGYEILAHLGSGGMARVYLAQATGNGGFRHLVAIKVLHRHLTGNAEFFELFLNEARIGGRLHHPNAVSVHAVGEADGRTYFVMDYVRGETFGDLLDIAGVGPNGLPLAMVLQVIADVAEGLHSAHEMVDQDGQHLNIVHRDLSPRNILVGYDGVARVADFGIAFAKDRGVETRTGVYRGTTPYLAPEQILGEPTDARTDVFALGTILWESTVGSRLFKHATEFGTLERILKMEIQPPSSLRHDCPNELNAIIMQALARPSDQRVASAQDLSDRLRHVMANMGHIPRPSALSTCMNLVFGDRSRLRMHQEGLLIDTNQLPRSEGSTAPVATNPTPQESAIASLPDEPPLLSKSGKADEPGSLPNGLHHIRTTWNQSPKVRMAVLLGAGSFVLVASLVLFSPTGSSNATGEQTYPDLLSSDLSATPPLSTNRDKASIAEMKEQVEITVLAEPATTKFEETDGTPMPPPWAVDASTTSLVVKAFAKGYRAQTIEVIPDRSKTISVRLAPHGRSSRARSTSRKSPKSEAKSPLLIESWELAK